MKTTQILLTMLALATAGFAQENAAKLALARDVIGAMHADKMFDGIAVQMKQMASQTAATMLPANTTPEQRKEFEKFQSKVMDMSMESAKGLIAQMDHVYADVYSEGELRAMLAFFSSPEGQSMLAKQPQAVARMMPAVQEMQRNLMPKIQQLAEELKSSITPAPAPQAESPKTGQ